MTGSAPVGPGEIFTARGLTGISLACYELTGAGPPTLRSGPSASRKISIVSAMGRRRIVSFVNSSNSAPAGEDRTTGGIKILVEGHIHGVEQGRIIGRRDPRIRGSKEQPGAV